MVPVLLIGGSILLSAINNENEYRGILVRRWLRGELTREQVKANLHILKQYKVKKD